MALRLLAAPPRAVPQLPPLGFLQSLACPISITVPPLLANLWDSVLRAVPKKKTSHMKKRHRQMAGKALKDVKSLCQCPACGQTKRQHVLCPHCVRGMSAHALRFGPSGSFSSARFQLLDQPNPALRYIGWNDT